MNIIVVLWLYDTVKHVWYTSIKMYCSFVGNLIFTGICSVLHLSLRFVFIVKWNIKHSTKRYKGSNFVTVIICVITYYKYWLIGVITYYKYWLIRLQYFAYTVSPSPWTYPSSGRYSLAVVAVHLLKLYCSLCCSQEYLQHAFFVLICKIQEMYFLLHAVYDWFASQHGWAGEIAPISRSPCSVLDCKMEHSLPWSIHPASSITCMGTKLGPYQ